MNVFKGWREVGAACATVTPFILKTGYRVTDDGDIVDLDGKPFAGYVASAHLTIASERKAKANARNRP